MTIHNTQYMTSQLSNIAVRQEASTKFTDTARIFKTINLKLLVIRFIMSRVYYLCLCCIHNNVLSFASTSQTDLCQFLVVFFKYSWRLKSWLFNLKDFPHFN